MNYLCPICGYNKLTAPAQDDLICPCCGTHFGLDDYAYSNTEIRDAWLSRGANWFSHRTPKPINWSLDTQLHNIGYVCTKADLEEVSFPEPTWSIAWIGIRTVGATPAYVSYVVSTHNDVVALFAPATQARNTNQTTSNSGFLTGLSVCLNS